MNTLVFKSSRIIFLLSVFLSTPSWADHQKKSTQEIADSLVQRVYQPTFAEILDAFGGKLPDSNPFLDPEHGSFTVQDIFIPTVRRSDRDYTLAELIAHYIVEIEAIYPGATWAFLGNDTRLIADSVDAFYVSIGQRYRVVPLTGSGPTIRIKDMNLLADFLESAGFDFENPLSNPAFIIVDGTGYTESSQIRHLLKAGYQRYVSKGGSPFALLSKLNALNTIRTYPTSGMRNGSHLEEFKRNNFEYFKAQHDHLLEQGDPFSEDLYAGIPNSLQYASYEVFDHDYWHHGYGPIILDEFGRRVGSVTAHSSELERRKIMATLYEEYKAIADPRFLELVQQEARKIGYEFPMKRNLEPVIKKPRRLSKQVRLSRISDDLRSLIHLYFSTRETITSRLNLVNNYFNGYQKDPLWESIQFLYLQVLVEECENGFIPNEDLPIYLQYFIFAVDFSSSSLIQNFSEFLNQTPGASAILSATLERAIPAAMNSQIEEKMRQMLNLISLYECERGLTHE